MKPAPTFGRRGRTEQISAAPRAAAAPAAPAITMASLLAAGDNDAPDALRAVAALDSRVALVGEAEMMLAIGPRWPAYRLTWIAMRDAPGLRPDFSFAAFFGQGLWLLYRKNYAAFFAFGAVSLAASYAMPGQRGGGVAGLAGELLIMVALALLLGLFGKSLVVMRAMRIVARVKAQNLSPGETAGLIARRGGVSLVAPIVATLVVFLLIFALLGGALLLLGLGGAIR